MTGTDHALHFIRSTTWADLPTSVQHQAKRCLLDTLGATLAGTQTPVARLVARFVHEQYLGDEATVLATGHRASTVGAALANGFAANALDIDDGHRLIKGHPGTCILPALLTMSERQGNVSGALFLTALVVGYELGIRAGLIRHALYETYHSSGSWGAIAAAGVGGKIINAEPHVLRQALGTAEYHAPIAPMMKGIATPSMGKDSIGWGGMVGVSSILMAQRGFTGIEPLFAETPIPEWVTGLGAQYEILNLYFKPYACCRWAQPAVTAVLEVVRDADLTPGDIATVSVYTFQAAASLSRKHPKNTEEAQYNLAYPVAATLLDGELGPRQVLPPQIFNPAVLALADQVQVEVVPEYERAFPAKTFTHVEVGTKSGQQLVSGRKEAIWEAPETLPTDDELEQKFFWLASPIIGKDKARRIVRMVWRFEDVSDARQLISLCTQ